MVNIKFGDVIAGAAKSLDRQLTDSLEETRELSRSARERAMARDEVAWQTYSKNKEETEVIIEELAAIAKKQNVSLPEGYTYYDYAGQLFSSAGSIDSAKQLSADIREGERLNLRMDGLVNFGDMQSGGMGFADVVNQLVRRPTKFTQPPGKVMGVGLLSNTDITDKIASAMDIQSSVPDAPEKTDFGKATIDYSRLKAATEYAQNQTLVEEQIEAARLGNDKARAELKEMGIYLDSSDIFDEFERQTDAGLSADMYQIDDDGNRVLKTDEQTLNKMFELQNKSLQAAVAFANSLDSLSDTAVQSAKGKKNQQAVISMGKQAINYVRPETSGKLPIVESDGTVTTGQQSGQAVTSEKPMSAGAIVRLKVGDKFVYAVWMGSYEKSKQYIIGNVNV